MCTDDKPHADEGCGSGDHHAEAEPDGIDGEDRFLSLPSVGDEIEVYWPIDDTFYPVLWPQPMMMTINITSTIPKAKKRYLLCLMKCGETLTRIRPRTYR
eukprot:gb/GEZJ01006678.1/.p1 GENE.gb/GEZJ01006678.1/~~gb/GEZJ01006678.1/.p1  ORF type:complete len:100 (+),score=2.45 gb/GEZJ01006678.1/:270-569(+)